ncbi:transporter substrate-binding domain-containing protein [Algoriphagus yeomjeoni]|uniref:Amino acid ABC transporter substrate-binding protein (PAAT family) n=1 Tax=Algoriphagus yeomjeoni TaxID=291403 RepID=A0A327NV21_9BACT|nr:transporter substrate-binding domain-containing protein [Algoriphagus yeomjeoni]RAI83850.1 amino acid ABC transporter substrate-binding protein (PAAT family) [Algoriphagus yeomjeoni]
MRSKTIYCYFIALILSLTSSNLFAQAEVSSADTLLVGVAGSQPFVFANNVENKGIAMDIWEELATKKGWNYRYKYFDKVETALSGLSKEMVDIVVGPISITSSRLEYMRFSQPFYNSSLSIVSRSDELTLWQKVKPFFSFKLIIAVGLFLFILALVGTLLWLAERKNSPDQFPKDPVNGIGNGMWLAVVTMSTVGYGDKAPVTLAGRIITGTWIIISIIFATSMVAGIASTLTLNSLGDSTILNIEQLSNKKAATLAGSPSEAFLKENKAKTIASNTLQEAMEKLEENEVEAVVYDRPQLLYYIKQNQGKNFYLAKAEYFKQGYGFAFPINSSLVYEVNRALLELSEGLETERIINNYLEKDE